LHPHTPNTEYAPRVAGALDSKEQLDQTFVDVRSFVFVRFHSSRESVPNRIALVHRARASPRRFGSYRSSANFRRVVVARFSGGAFFRARAGGAPTLGDAAVPTLLRANPNALCLSASAALRANCDDATAA